MERYLGDGEYTGNLDTESYHGRPEDLKRHLLVL
jgi:hypothetical protein